MWYLALAGIVALVLVGGLISLQSYGTLLDRLIRGVALLGYLSVFSAAISSTYMRHLVRFFGRPFVQVHHILSATGLVLITLHPLGVAWSSASLRVFLPRLDSWFTFLQWGGAPAWYLIGAASLIAVLRKIVGRPWRVIHSLNYAAFWLGTIHAILNGTDFQRTIVKAVPIGLALIVTATLIQKRFQRRRR
jgi:hypothetical protein